ncbi:MAG: heavy metal sensor histidine kinase [Acidobacteriota bacterium]|nr:heavy metal sensor histidine kinase [Acidobacteriota bacterium]
MNTRSIRFRLTVWYAGLLAALLALFGISVYFGLARYLEWSLKDSLTKQAQQIAVSHLADVRLTGEDYVIGEIREHYAPEINSRLVRVTRADGSLMYVSGAPQDGSFDPTGLPVPTIPDEAQTREVHLPQGDGEVLLYTMPFTVRDGSRFIVETGAPYDAIESVLHGLLLTLALGLPVIVVLSIGGGYFVMRRALEPVDALTRSAERITSRNLNERLPIVPTGDELERLSVALNSMVARLDAAFTHIRRFSADASHELRTPLTVLRGELEGIVQEPHLTTEMREMIGSALEETERLSKIVESLLVISRLDAGEARMERARFDLAELTATTVEQLRLLAEDKNITLVGDTHGTVEVEGDRARLKQVVVNLVDNAIKYTPAGGRVEVRVKREDAHALLEVKDTGAGIPKEALLHIFERFYRVDMARSRAVGGTGLGLAIVKSICAAHGGQVKVESTENKGSRFEVQLPAAGVDNRLAQAQGESQPTGYANSAQETVEAGITKNARQSVAATGEKL